MSDGFVSAWQRRGLLAWLLAPLSLVYAVALGARRLAYAVGLIPVARVPVPVVVIGNLYVGGTGKTPLTIALVQALRRRGWRPAPWLALAQLPSRSNLTWLAWPQPSEATGRS